MWAYGLCILVHKHDWVRKVVICMDINIVLEMIAPSRHLTSLGQLNVYRPTHLASDWNPPSMRKSVLGTLMIDVIKIRLKHAGTSEHRRLLTTHGSPITYLYLLRLFFLSIPSFLYSTSTSRDNLELLLLALSLTKFAISPYSRSNFVSKFSIGHLVHDDDIRHTFEITDHHLWKFANCP